MRYAHAEIDVPSHIVAGPGAVLAWISSALTRAQIRTERDLPSDMVLSHTVLGQDAKPESPTLTDRSTVALLWKLCF